MSITLSPRTVARLLASQTRHPVSSQFLSSLACGNPMSPMVHRLSPVVTQCQKVQRRLLRIASAGSTHTFHREALSSTSQSLLPAVKQYQRTPRRLLRTTSAWSPQLGTDPGLDSSTPTTKQGLDSQHDSSDNIITIKIVDYSSKETAQHQVEHSALDSFLQSNPKPEWASCRWIYVNGIDQSVLRSLGSAYNLHRLALEDVLESRGPTKADWYDGHLFIALPLHKLLSPKVMEEEFEQRMSKFAKSHRKHSRDWRTIAHQKFNVSVEQASVFWSKTGTVITIFHESGDDVFKHVMNRLDSPHSVLKSSDDPSMLIQAVIDVAVDLCMPIEKAFADEFTEMEMSVLSNPTIQQSRSLYILRSRLTLLLDNFIAINSLLKKLCGDHPLSSINHPLPGTSGERERFSLDSDTFDSCQTSASAQPAHMVAISSTTQLYLRDVLDHVHSLSASTDVAIRSTENLTSLIFNTIAASQNESVRQLTVVSSFFLPLTFLTGYMGMNFESMPVVQQHSDLVFWAIAAPAMITMGLFMTIRSRNRRRLSSWWLARMTGSRR